MGALLAFLGYILLSEFIIKKTKEINRYTNKVVGILFLTLGIVAIFQACTPAKSETPDEKITPEKKIIRVKTAPISTTKKAMPITNIGALMPKDEIKLSFKLGGVISTILVKEGQFIKKGQLIAQLEQTEINAQVTKAETSLSKAKTASLDILSFANCSIISWIFFCSFL